MAEVYEGVRFNDGIRVKACEETNKQEEVAA
jgi:hypothetical protein